MNSEDPTRYQTGLELRRRTLGAEYVDSALAHATELTQPFQEFVTEYAWGAVWSRPGLPAATRSLVTLAILAALNQREELKLHLEAALRNGCQPAEIREALFQVGLYAGLPAAVAGFGITQQVLDAANPSGGDITE